MQNKQYLFLVSLVVFNFSLLRSQTVFVSSKGKKYHLEHCPGLAADKRAKLIQDAEKEGYKPHKGCKVKESLKKQAAENKEDKKEKDQGSSQPTKAKTSSASTHTHLPRALFHTARPC